MRFQAASNQFATVKRWNRCAFCSTVIGNRCRQIGHGNIRRRAIGVEQRIILPDAIRAFFVKAHGRNGKHHGRRQKRPVDVAARAQIVEQHAQSVGGGVNICGEIGRVHQLQIRGNIQAACAADNQVIRQLRGFERGKQVVVARFHVLRQNWGCPSPR